MYKGDAVPYVPPPLLDQVASGQLARLAPATIGHSDPPEGDALSPSGAAATGRSLRRLLKHVLPPAFLVVGVVMIVGAGFGLADAMTDGEITNEDLVRLVIIGFGALTIAAPAWSMFSSIRGGRGLATLVSRLGKLLLSLPRRLRPPASASALAAPHVLLDQMTAAELSRVAPPGLGRRGVREAATRKGWQNTQMISWLLLLVTLIGVLTVVGGMLLLEAVQSLLDGDSLKPAILIRLVGGALSAVGVIALVRTLVSSLTNRKRRKRANILKRLSRYLLRLFDSGVRASQTFASALFGNLGAFSPAVVGLGIGRLAVATLAVGALGFVPLFTSVNVLGLTGSDGPSAVAGVVASPAPETQTASPTRAGSPTPRRTATPTPTRGATDTAPPSATLDISTAPPTAAPITITPPPSTPGSIVVDPPNYCNFDLGIPAPSGTTADYSDFAGQLSQVTNNYRAGLGLAPLAVDSQLVAAAQQHAEFVLPRRWWDPYQVDRRIHCDLVPRDELNRVHEAGYPLDRGPLVGENVAWGDVHPNFPAERAFEFICGPRDAAGHCTLNEDPALMQDIDGNPVNFVKTGLVCLQRPDSQQFTCVQVLAE